MHNDPERRSRQDPEGVPQADPQLQEGRVGGLHIAAVMLALAVLVGVVLYGVNQRGADTVTAGAPPAAPSQTTGAAPQTGGNVAGGENRNVQPESSPDRPQQPAPDAARPTTDGSQR